MKLRYNLLPATFLLLAFGCRTATQNLSLSPESGTILKAGKSIAVNLHYSIKPDSIVYLLDSVKIGSKQDSSVLTIKTDSLKVGQRLITAKVYQNGKSQDISTDIVLLAAKAPEEYTYKVVKVFPHDTSSYTEGLQYVDGVLYESTGNYGTSTIRKSDLNTGKALKVTKLDKKYFGEGISVVGDKVIQMTYREKVGFIYDKNSLNLLSTFENKVGNEGWGMCFDGKKLYFDDGTSRVWFLNKDNYHLTGYIDVFDDKGAINEVNELEYIDNKLYANVYTKDTILVIEPKTGAVLQRVDMKNLWPATVRPKDFDNINSVLNGIAWDEKGRRLFVTGKNWPHIYQIALVKK